MSARQAVCKAACKVEESFLAIRASVYCKLDRLKLFTRDAGIGSSRVGKDSELSLLCNAVKRVALVASGSRG